MTLLIKDPEATLDYGALQRVDLLLCPVVEMSLAVPPASPVLGACYLVADGATDAWAGKVNMLAGYTEGGWRFVTPIDGMHVVDRSSGLTLIRNGGSWEAGVVRAEEIRIGGQAVVGAQQPGIADPAGGAVIDIESRTAIGAMLTALRTHGLIA